MSIWIIQVFEILALAKAIYNLFLDPREIWILDTQQCNTESFYVPTGRLKFRIITFANEKQNIGFRVKQLELYWLLVVIANMCFAVGGGGALLLYWLLVYD